MISINIESLDTDISDLAADYLDEGMAENVGEAAPSDSEVPGDLMHQINS